MWLLHAQPGIFSQIFLRKKARGVDEELKYIIFLYPGVINRLYHDKS